MSNGGQILVKSLQAHGVERVFCVAGESYLPVLDALVDAPDIEVITCRHESGATFMADAYAQMTGKPGVAFVTRGPGACNGSIGIHTARQSSTPVILFSGLIATHDKDRESFQEFDLPQMFASLSKWSSNIDRGERIAEYVARAFHVSQSGRPGPVVLGLPEEVVFSDVPEQKVTTIPSSSVTPADADIKAAMDMLAGAQKPLIIVGGGDWDQSSAENIIQFAEKNDIPVASAFRRIDVMDHASDCYIGELGFGPNPELVEFTNEADVVFVIGSRIDEITVQAYSLLRGDQKLIHLYPAGEEFGRAAYPDLVIQAHVGPTAEVLASLAALKSDAWANWREKTRASFTAWTADQDEEMGWDGADMTAVFCKLREMLPEDAIVTGDAGNFSGWAQRYLRFKRPGRYMAPMAGAMGYAVPSVVSAALQHRDKVTLGICGDGGFMMTGQEIATAVHHGAKPTILVCNNSMFGTIRMHQQRDFPGRVSGTGLTNPDFVKLAESYGAFGARIEKAADVEQVWKEAVAQDKPALIEIVQDQRQISTTSKL